MNFTNFQLQFAPGKIKELAARYSYRLQDREAFFAGEQLARGAYSRANLEIIFRWKTGGRGISRLNRNSDAEVEDALRVAVTARTERSAISVLSGLFGVEIPVASAILTAVDQERYTIIDFRALEALGIGKAYHTVDSYLNYLAHCRLLAQQNDVGLRELDRALWQWSAEQPSSRL